jgi:hypothetical protein
MEAGYYEARDILRRLERRFLDFLKSLRRSSNPPIAQKAPNTMIEAASNRMKSLIVVVFTFGFFGQ